MFTHTYTYIYIHAQVSNLTAHMLKQENGLDVLLKGRAHVVCENADFLLNFEKDDKKAFGDMVALFGKGKFVYMCMYIYVQDVSMQRRVCVSVCVYIHIYNVRA